MKLLIARLIGLTTLALGAVLGQAPHLAMAVGCGTQWAAPVDGYWGDATKWTGGIPNNNVACIDVAGTYTVTVGVTPFNVDGLVVGGSSGTQTLLIDGGVIGTSLSMQAGTGGAVSSIGANGKLVLTNLTANAGAAIFRAPTGSDFDAAHITNNGTIEIIDGLGTAGAARYLSGNILNQGTIKVYRDTAMDTSSTLWKNQGAIDLGTGDTLTFVDTGCGGCRPTFLNDTNGSITGAGTFLLNGLIHANNGFFQGAGTIGSTANVVLNSSSLHYVGSGAGKIIAHGTGNVADGNMAAGQELVIEAVDNGSAVDAKVFFDQASTTAAGTIRLTHAGTGAAGAATLVTAAGVSETFTNSGSIISEDGVGGSSSTRSIQGNITSSGTITISHDTAVDRANSVWTNTGTVTIASGKTLSFVDTSCGGCRPTFKNNGGSLTGSGTFAMNNIIHSANGFFQGAGTIGVNLNVVLTSSSVHFTGSGAGKIIAHGTGNVADGNMAAGQELVIEAVDNGSAVDAKVFFDQASTTAAGTIRLTHAGTGAAGAATLVTAAGVSETFTNSGSIISEDGVGGAASSRAILGNLANSGTVTINRTTTIDRGQSVWSNTGTITIASGKSLIFPDKACGGCQPTFYNLAGGSIAGSGSLTMDNSNNTSNGFFQDAGTIGSSVSVVLHNSGLHLTGTGAGKIYLHAYNVIYGNLASGQELVVERANSEDALANNDLAMTNAGTITLVAGNGSATLRIQGGQTLTNNGTLRGVGTVIAGTVSNAGTVSPGASAGVLTISGNYSQTSGGTLATEIGGATAGTQYDQLAVSGTASLNGTLALSQLNSFVPTSGQTFAIVTHASRTGTFSSVTGASVGGKQYAANYASGTQTTLTVGSSVTRQVDALINQGKSTFIGDGIYNTTGLNQAKTASVKVGVTVSFKIKIQNDGTGGSDQFFVLASGSNVNGFTVVYKKGTKNITSQVLAGTYKTAAIAPGGSVTIRVKIVASNKAVKNSAINRIVTLTSAADGTKQDAVKITVTRI